MLVAVTHLKLAPSLNPPTPAHSWLLHHQ